MSAIISLIESFRWFLMLTNMIHSNYWVWPLFEQQSWYTQMCFPVTCSKIRKQVFTCSTRALERNWEHYRVHVSKLDGTLSTIESVYTCQVDNVKIERIFISCGKCDCLADVRNRNVKLENCAWENLTDLIYVLDTLIELLTYIGVTM